MIKFISYAIQTISIIILMYHVYLGYNKLIILIILFNTSFLTYMIIKYDESKF